ncbi:ATP-dependent RNA helicase dhx8 [Perkinsus chesapeaki]|uniref:ATP-dependent RNA helicase dhx8 n=1 Tax=Perkinsus chesapeaki TaxID=330153 RepID=A0A7J6L9U4_PERCH|nr:ATP-dependent RNA helicase dhx8 [Perkinsus chesapeaki]
MRQQSLERDVKNPDKKGQPQPSQQQQSSSSSSSSKPTTSSSGGDALLSAAGSGRTDVWKYSVSETDTTSAASSESLPSNPFLLSSTCRYTVTDLGLALCEGALKGHSGVVKAIIEASPAAVKYCDPSTGFNALHYAAMNSESGKVAATIVRLLLGAKCQLRNSVLHVCNNAYVLPMLLEYPGIDLEGLNRHRVTPLAAQVRADHVEMCEELIRAGAKVPSSLLFSAKSADAARALLHAGADPNVQDAFGYTPLHLAVEGELRSVARVLLEYKADPHKQAYDGITPLAMGASSRAARLRAQKSFAVKAESSASRQEPASAGESPASPVCDPKKAAPEGSSSSSSSANPPECHDETPPLRPKAEEVLGRSPEVNQHPSSYRVSQTFQDIRTKVEQLDDALLSYNSEVEEFMTTSAEWHALEERMEFLMGKVRRLKGRAIEAEAEARRREREQRSKQQGTSDTCRSLTDESLCVVCQSELRTVVLMPCRHMCVCTGCSERLGSECPLCRDHIKERLKVFT